MPTLLKANTFTGSDLPRLTPNHTPRPMATTSTTAVTVMMIFFLFCFFIPGTSLLLLVVSTELPSRMW